MSLLTNQTFKWVLIKLQVLRTVNGVICSNVRKFSGSFWVISLWVWLDRPVSVARGWHRDACQLAVQMAHIPKPPMDHPPDACPHGTWPGAAPNDGESAQKKVFGGFLFGNSCAHAPIQTAGHPVDGWDLLYHTVGAGHEDTQQLHT